jgi:hypothetical protein
VGSGLTYDVFCRESVAFTDILIDFLDDPTGCDAGCAATLPPPTFDH